MLILAAGCASVPDAPSPPVARAAPPPSAIVEIARGRGVVVVRAGAGDTAPSLAQRYLGDAREVQRVMPVTRPRPGDGRLIEGEAVAIALEPLDPGGTLSTPAQTATILCYHRFSSRSGGSRMEMGAGDFDLQVRHLIDHGYSIIPLKRLIGFLDGTADLPPKPVVITVDDGYRSFFSLALPIVEKYRVPVTLFPYTRFVGGGDALSWTQLQLIRKTGLVDIEAHSKSHSDLTQRRRGESARSYKRRLEDELDAHQLAQVLGDAPPTAFAYPYGAANAAVLAAANAGGWRLGLTVLRGTNSSWSDPLLLRREMIYGPDTMAAFDNRLGRAGSGLDQR